MKDEERDTEVKQEIKYMSAGDFQDIGFLQEVNRRFFHPLGMALAIETGDPESTKFEARVWDYRHDPEGMIFDGGPYGRDPLKEQRVWSEFQRHKDARLRLFGSPVQPCADLAAEDVETPISAHIEHERAGEAQ